MKRTLSLSSLVILVLLTACSLDELELRANPTSPARQVLFQDDFSDKDSGWLTLREENRIIDYEDGGFRIWVNQPGFDYWSVAGISFTDVVLEVEATKLGGPDDNDFGLICRYVDEETFYGFLISSDGYYGITKRNQGDHQVISAETMQFSNIIKIGDATNTIRAECVGNRLSFWVNGMKLAEEIDNDYSTGDVGLIAGSFDKIGVDILFDNFVMTKP